MLHQFWVEKSDNIPQYYLKALGEQGALNKFGFVSDDNILRNAL